jgi:Tol biopolymer transport system component
MRESIGQQPHMLFVVRKPAVLICLAVALTGCERSPVVSTRAGPSLEGRIVFVGGAWPHRDLYSIRPDGTDLYQLTNTDSDEDYPSVSPDRSKIAFTSNRDGNYAVFVMAPDGSGLMRVSGDTTADASSPSWSPDGQHLTFNLGGSSNWIVGLDGAGLRSITFVAPLYPDDWESAPAWAPNGNQIAYLRGCCRSDLMMTGPSGLNRWIAWPCPALCHSASWSPDGAWIALAAVRLDSLPFHSIALLPVAGGPVQRITGSRVVDDVSPAWSADGSQLVFARLPGPRLWLVNKDGSNPHLLIDMDGDNPAWYGWPH